MTTKWKLGIFLTGIILLVTCDKDSSEYDITTRQTIGNDILLNSNSEWLSSRIRTFNERLLIEDINPENTRLKNLNAPPEADLTKNYSFHLRAEVPSPVVDGQTLMATHVKIHDRYAFVTYNTRGEKYLGGIEVLDVSDINHPVIVYQAIFTKTDISAVDFYNNKLYLVGATDISAIPDAGLRTPALLEILELDQKHKITGVDTILNLDSYAGTDVKVTPEGIFATSGSNGYIRFFDLNTYFLCCSSSMPNARSVDVNTGYIFALSGQPGRITIYNRNGKSLVKSFLTGGATIPGSKSEIAVNDQYIFAALNDGGLKVFTTDGTLRQHIPCPPTPDGRKAEDFVTNSVSLNEDLVLIGNGEAGLYVGGIIESRSDSIFLLGKIKFGDYESANFVESKDSLIFVANGLGGLKILSVGTDDGVPEDIIPTKPCPALYDRIKTLFPEAKNNMKIYPDLFTAQTAKNIILTKASEVYITFVDENASWKNSLGYYTYNLSNPPAKAEDLEKHLLFPNVSKANEGGGLHTGDMLRIGTGKFPAYTVIGFYLNVLGWKNGIVTEGRYTHYTDPGFNLGGYQQHTLFTEKNCNDLVMTFEDMSLNDTEVNRDYDFNDILFVISDNKDPNHTTANTAFDLSNIPVK